MYIIQWLISAKAENTTVELAILHILYHVVIRMRFYRCEQIVSLEISLNHRIIICVKRFVSDP